MNNTLILILANAVISLAALYAFPKIFEYGMLKPYRVWRENTWYELISSGFVHASMGHLFLNMFTLFFFGPVLERSLGSFHFLMLYFTGLLVSSLPSIFFHRDDPDYATVGASGAVESVLFGFILLFPLEKIYIILIPVGIPAFVFGIFFLGYSLYASRGEGKINHGAHIAGAVWGLLYLLIFVPNTIDHILTIMKLI